MKKRVFRERYADKKEEKEVKVKPEKVEKKSKRRILEIDD